MGAHTSTPWELFDRCDTLSIRNPRAHSSKSEIVFWTGFDSTHYPKQARANAAFIVKAVNNHDALVNALALAEAVLNEYAIKNGGQIEALLPIRKALAEAGGAYLSPSKLPRQLTEQL